MFEIFVKHHFSAAHKLNSYDGECSNLHGHNWLVKVYARTSKLNNIGISLDFKEFKKIAKEEIDKLDHVYLNEYPAFINVNPTAENISKFLYENLSERLNDDDLKMHMVEVWESENQGCRYLG